MERLTQKYAQWFYITLILGALWQLVGTIIDTLNCEISHSAIVLIILAIVNIIILGSSFIHIRKQRFIECKATTKIARFTMLLFLLLQMYSCYKLSPSWISLGNHSILLILVELALNYRIKTIEHLEKLATHISP